MLLIDVLITVLYIAAWRGGAVFLHAHYGATLPTPPLSRWTATEGLAEAEG